MGREPNTIPAGSEAADPASSSTIAAGGGSRPPLLLFSRRNVYAFPVTKSGADLEAGLKLDALEVFTTDCHTDAHFAAYVSPTSAFRLKRDALRDGSYRDAGAPCINYFVVDVDGPNHGDRAPDGSPLPLEALEQPAPWRAAERVKLDALLAIHPGAFMYETRGGYRIVYRLPPFPCGPGWKPRYLAFLDYLEASFGIGGDRACADWTRLFRAPRATRNSRIGPEKRPTIGDPAAIGFWTYEPTPEALQAARRRTSHTKPRAPSAPLGRPGLLELQFGRRGLMGTRRSPWINVVCPWDHEHSSPCAGAHDSSTAITEATQSDPVGVFKCLHAHCTDRTARDVLARWNISRAEIMKHALAARTATGSAVSAAQAVSTIRRELATAAQGPGTLTLMRVTTGGGKTTAAVELLAHLRDGLVSVGTHALGRQIEDALGALGVPAVRREGIGALAGPDGAPVCSYPEELELMGRLQIPGRLLCVKCLLRKSCAASSGAARSTADGVTIVTHNLLPIHLLQDPRPRLAIIDEPESTTTSVQWQQPEWLLHHLDSLGPATHCALGPLLNAFTSGLASGTPVQGASLRDVVRAASPSPDVVIANAAALQYPQWDGDWMMKFADTLRFERDIFSTPFKHRRGRAPRPADTEFTLLKVLWAAARAPAAPLVHLGEKGLVLTARSASAVVTGAFVRSGGVAVLLDATGDRDALAAASQVPLRVVDVTVTDSAAWERRVIYWGNAPRRWCLRFNRPDPAKLIGPMRRIAQSAAARGSRRLAIFTYKLIADSLRAWKDGGPRPAWVPVELEMLVRGGVEVSIGHFGGLRGLNDWEGFDHFAVLGDPRSNVDATDMAARTLGIPEFDFGTKIALAELTQAFGRARTPHSPRGGVIEYYGTLTPDGLGWADAKVMSLDEDPAALTGEQLRTLRTWLGLTQLEAANLLGTSRQSWIAWEKRKHVPPGRTHEILAALAGAAPARDAPSAFKPLPLTAHDLEELRSATAVSQDVSSSVLRLARVHHCTNAAAVLLDVAVAEYMERVQVLDAALAERVRADPRAAGDLGTEVRDLEGWYHGFMEDLSMLEGQLFPASAVAS